MGVFEDLHRDRVAGSLAMFDRMIFKGYLTRLYPRENVRCFALVAHGVTNDEIATELQIRPATARIHVSRAMVKVNARDRAQLVVFAYQTGLVRPAT